MGDEYLCGVSGNASGVGVRAAPPELVCEGYVAAAAAAAADDDNDDDDLSAGRRAPMTILSTPPSLLAVLFFVVVLCGSVWVADDRAVLSADGVRHHRSRCGSRPHCLHREALENTSDGGPGTCEAVMIRTHAPTDAMVRRIGNIIDANPHREVIRTFQQFRQCANDYLIKGHRRSGCNAIVGTRNGTISGPIFPTTSCWCTKKRYEADHREYKSIRRGVAIKATQESGSCKCCTVFL